MPAWAQASKQPEPIELAMLGEDQDGHRRDGVDIVVTGERDEEIVVEEARDAALFGNIGPRELPFAFNAVNEVEIKNRLATTFSEALLTDPAIDVVFGGGGDNPYEAFIIRGFSVSTTIYDGTPQSYSTTRPTETTAQIELLRGAAGFRYGFISPGGAINIVGKKPTEETFLRVNATADSNAAAGVHLDAGGRLGAEDTFGYRINLLASNDPTFLRDYSRTRYVAAGAFDVRLSPSTTLTAIADLSMQQSRGPGASGYRTIGLYDGVRLPDPIPDPSLTWLPLWDRSDLTELNLFARLNSRFAGDWTLDLSGGRSRNHEVVYGGAAFGAWGPNGEHTLNYTGYVFDPESLNAVGQVYGTARTGPVTHNLAFGGLWRRYNAPLEVPTNSGMRPTPSSLFAPALLPYEDPVFVDAGAFGDKQYGVFAQDRMEIGRLGVIAGIRWSRFKAPATASSQAVTNAAWTPIGALTFEPRDGLLTYVSYAEGLESGGRAPADATNAFQTLPALRSRSYEAGFKLDLAGGRATLDGSVFSIERTAAFLDADRLFVQDGKQRHNGVELLVKGAVLPALSVSGGFQYLHARYLGSPGIAGETPDNIPEWRATLFADYRVAGVRGLFVNALARYVGEREVTVPNGYKVPAYVRADLGLRYETQVGGRGLTLRLQAANLFDKRYWVTASRYGAEFGAPLTVNAGIEVGL